MASALFCSSSGVSSIIVEPSRLWSRALLSVLEPWWRALTEGDLPSMPALRTGCKSDWDWVGSWLLFRLFLFVLTAKFVVLSTFFNREPSPSMFDPFTRLVFLGLTSTLSATLGFFFMLFSSMSASASTSKDAMLLLSFVFFFTTCGSYCYWSLYSVSCFVILESRESSLTFFC